MSKCQKKSCTFRVTTGSKSFCSKHLAIKRLSNDICRAKKSGQCLWMQFLVKFKETCTPSELCLYSRSNLSREFYDTHPGLSKLHTKSMLSAKEQGVLNESPRSSKITETSGKVHRVTHRKSASKTRERKQDNVITHRSIRKFPDGNSLTTEVEHRASQAYSETIRLSLEVEKQTEVYFSRLKEDFQSFRGLSEWEQESFLGDNINRVSAVPFSQVSGKSVISCWKEELMEFIRVKHSLQPEITTAFRAGSNVSTEKVLATYVKRCKVLYQIRKSLNKLKAPIFAQMFTNASNLFQLQYYPSLAFNQILNHKTSELKIEPDPQNGARFVSNTNYMEKVRTFDRNPMFTRYEECAVVTRMEVDRAFASLCAIFPKTQMLHKNAEVTTDGLPVYEVQELEGNVFFYFLVVELFSTISCYVRFHISEAWKNNSCIQVLAPSLRHNKDNSKQHHQRRCKVEIYHSTTNLSLLQTRNFGSSHWMWCFFIASKLV